MKKIMAYVFTVLFLFTAAFGNKAVEVRAANETTVYLDGTRVMFNASPNVTNNEFRVEAIPFFEALGLSVSWNSSSETLSATKGGFSLTMTAGQSTVILNSGNISVSVIPIMIDGRLFTPLFTALGITYAWNANDYGRLDVTSTVKTTDIQNPTATDIPRTTATNAPITTSITTSTTTSVTAPNVDANGRSYWSEEGFGLYRVNADGTGFTRISDDWALDIHVSGDWIYYSLRVRNWFPEGTSSTYPRGIFRIRTDGSGRTSLFPSSNRDHVVRVANDWVYYSCYNINKSSYELYRMRSDGTSITMLDFAGTFEDAYIDGDWIYTFYGDNDKARDNRININKVKLDGTGKTNLVSNVIEGPSSYPSGYLVTVIDGTLYYSCATENGNDIYAVRTDGSGGRKLLVGANSIIGVSGGRIYYTKYTDSGPRIFSRSADGTGAETEFNTGRRVDYASLINGRIFYMSTVTSGGYATAGAPRTSDLLRINTDGTGNENLTNFTMFTPTSSGASVGNINNNNNNSNTTTNGCTVCPNGQGWDFCKTCDGRGTLNGEPCPNFRCLGGRVECLATLNH